MVFKITKDAISLRGKVSHSENVRPISPNYWYGYESYDTTVKRSLYIGDMLYTLSDKFLKANDLGNLGEVTKVELKKEKDDDITIY